MEIDMNRENPIAAMRRMVQNLDRHTCLSPAEQATVLNALKSTRIPVDRVLASLAKETLETALNEF